MQTPPEGDRLTRHTAGLALDIILFNSNPVERALAHHLFKLFLEYKHHMNWLGLIYENVALNRHGNPLSYTQDNKHRTHIHIDWLIVEDVTWTDERNADGKPVVAKTIPWPGEAHTTGFADRLRPPLTVLNTDMNTLAPIDLMKLSGLAGQKG